MAAERDVTSTGTTNEDENECRGDAAESLNGIQGPFSGIRLISKLKDEISSGEMNRYRPVLGLIYLPTFSLGRNSRNVMSEPSNGRSLETHPYTCILFKENIDPTSRISQEIAVHEGT